MTNNWNSFTKLFAATFPQFKGREMLKMASPFYQQTKNAHNVFFGANGIIADGTFIRVVPLTDAPAMATAVLPVNPGAPVRRGPTGYNLFVNSHPRTERLEACLQWMNLNENQKAMYRRIAASGDWRAFYALRAFTDDLSPTEHLAEFFMLSDGLKRVLNNTR